jgi:hypothetical protein
MMHTFWNASLSTTAGIRCYRKCPAKRDRRDNLVFTDHRLPRAEALAAINAALRAGRDRLAKRGFQVQAPAAADMIEAKLLAQRDDLSVKIEVNTVIRGTVHPKQMVALTAAASDALMADLELPLLSSEDIYGGKLVAAMDRQHPRDLFDVMELFAHAGIMPAIRRAFVVYLASHIRTIQEVLFPSSDFTDGQIGARQIRGYLPEQACDAGALRHEPGVRSPVEVFRIEGGRHHDDRHFAVDLSHGLEELDAVHVGHDDVRYHQLEGVLLEQLQAFPAAVGGLRLMPGLRKELRDDLEDDLRVIYY